MTKKLNYPVVRGFQRVDESQRPTMADVCELADSLTIRECNILGITYDKYNKRDEMSYTSKAQKIFDHHYNLITNTLKI